MASAWAGRRLHFVGVGGAGMSAYARAAHALGASVSGSDRADSAFAAALAADGVLEAAIGHRAENVPAGDGGEVVCSTAIGADNAERVAALDGLDGANFRVLHVTGERDWPALRSRPRGPLYDLREYLDREQFGQALAASDLVVARAGGSIFEIAAYARPAILVPFPTASADHQRTNAEWMERAGAAVVVADSELSGPRLAAEVGRLVGDPSRLAAMGRASLAIARPDAAAAVATILLATG